MRTDKTLGRGVGLTVLGLVGETGSLLSETKKRQRDASTYIGYGDNVSEELGDLLWYLAVLARHRGASLSTLAGNGEETTFADLQPQRSLPMGAPTPAFERTLLRLAAVVGRLAEVAAASHSTEAMAQSLASVFAAVLEVANESGVFLGDSALRNLTKADDRWPAERRPPALFDDAFPSEERLPRALDVDIFERVGGNGRPYVVQRCNGIFIGDRLTDNIMTPDDYRFHDAFHYAYAAVLGWSPVTRALLRLKRKSEARVDEGEDGARAILIEEGVATYVFGRAKLLDFFDGLGPGELDFTFLKSVRQFVTGYEVESSPLWLWEEAILAGNRAFRHLRERRSARLRLDLATRSLTVGPMPE